MLTDEEMFQVLDVLREFVAETLQFWKRVVNFLSVSFTAA